MFGGRGGFPGGFFESHGFGGHGHSHEEEVEKDVDNKGLYEILEISQTATTEEIKKAYKKKAMKFHPDKGGDPEKFKEISAAHEVLTNQDKREIYDKYGLEGLKEGAGAGGFDPFGGIFGDIFGMGGRGGKGGAGKQLKKTKPQVKEIKVTLEEVYTGKMSKLPLKRQKACQTCDGKGGANAKKCTACKGHGIVEKVVQIAPGFLSSSRGPCNDCKGEGVKIDKGDICKDCKGNKMNQETKTIDVPIEQGAPDGHQAVFHGEGDEIPGTMAGDVVVTVTIEPHKRFERKGADLYFKKSISLYEALTGVSFVLEHLDGKKINITTAPGEIIKPGDLKQLNRKGMPYYKDAMSHGNLYILFNIDFPKKGEIKNIDKLKEILPVPSGLPTFDKKNAEYLEDYDETSKTATADGSRRRGGDDDDEDEDAPRGGQRVQCAQQ